MAKLSLVPRKIKICENLLVHFFSKKIDFEFTTENLNKKIFPIFTILAPVRDSCLRHKT